MRAGKCVFGVSCLCLLAQISLAQETVVAETSKWQVRDLSFQYGLNTLTGTQVQVADFARLAPNSEILKRDRTNFTGSHSSYTNQVSTASVLVGFNLSDYDIATNKPLHQFRVGVTYASEGGLSNSFSRMTRAPFDTLTSLQTGNAIFLDSVSHEHISMGYSAEQIRLDGAYLLRFWPEGRFSFFTGFGATVGLSLNSYTNISYTNWTELEGRDEAGNFVYYPSPGAYGEYQYEAVTNKTSYGISAYVPIGVDFLVSRRNDLLNKMHLFLESRPGINFLIVPELETYRKAQMSTSLGIRIVV